MVGSGTEIKISNYSCGGMCMQHVAGDWSEVQGNCCSLYMHGTEWGCREMISGGAEARNPGRWLSMQEVRDR